MQVMVLFNQVINPSQYHMGKVWYWEEIYYLLCNINCCMQFWYWCVSVFLCLIFILLYVCVLDSIIYQKKKKKLGIMCILNKLLNYNKWDETIFFLELVRNWFYYMILLLRVRLVEGVKKWEDRKSERMKKWKDRKDFNFSFFFCWKWKSRGMKKMNLYKFTHTSLLKNDGQLKQKVTNK